MKRHYYTAEGLKDKKFNRLTFTNEIASRNSKRFCKWKCDCGNEVEAELYSVSAGRIKSCGCLKKGRIRENNSNWLGIGDMYGDFWARIKHSAQSRKYNFSISKSYVWKLFLSQDRKCAITGQPLCFRSKYNVADGTASLDRIDSCKGYIRGNVQWVHKDINIMKQKFPQDYFIKLCKMVALANS